MITAVDSSVLIDILGVTGDAPRSESAVQTAMNEGSLIACEVVWAEVAAWFVGADDQAVRLADIGLSYSSLGESAAHEAGRAWRSYREAGGTRARLVGDFLIGAHAQIHADRLLTRDRGFFRNHFADLQVIEPA